MSLIVVSLTLATGLMLAAQQPVPQPFPRPGQGAPAETPPTPPSTETPSSATAALRPPDEAVPTEATLGFPIYPGAQFITSYDAGRGQRYYLFGSAVPFDTLVTYYRTVLKTRGDRVFETPPTHVFEVGRFREETMAFPPGVTIKDYAWGGSGGYLNPRVGAEPASFATVVQIVPAPTTPGAQ